MLELHRPAAALCLVAALALPGLATAQPASAPASTEAPSAAIDPALEARMMALAAELRCLVCQNQTIADSHAGLAEDLRRQIREMLARGLSDQQVRDYMTARYGDFVLYRPPFKASTALLWAGPGVLLVAALGTLAAVLRRRQRLGDQAFDPETPDDDEPR
ncbi:cytochrome c-type biogenesis protein [Ideonella sp. DXS22W]|uniref:Cytochrome c-type biogenesis protein n=1 Tax=Pseudaquabacterium inlustre TaxID=2984192 RepID=A0ABU9CDJ1_9BURK